jgi:hypothetical protein
MWHASWPNPTSPRLPPIGDGAPANPAPQASCVGRTGSAFPADAPAPSGALAPELALALAQARRGNPAPLRVRVDAPFDEPSIARWRP